MNDTSSHYMEFSKPDLRSLLPDESTPSCYKDCKNLLPCIFFIVGLILFVISLIFFFVSREKRGVFVCIVGKKSSSNGTLDSTNQYFVNATYEAGANVILLDLLPELNDEFIESQNKLCDGILFQGGIDVDPSLFNEEPDPLLEDHDLFMDKFQIRHVNFAAKRKVPMLGICRGIQILAVGFGGSMYQDVLRFQPKEGISRCNHRNYSSNGEAIVTPLHNITIVEETLLRKILNTETKFVNSIHHQSVKDIPKGFKINAYATDGIIEGIEKEEDGWVLAVQFHPEIMVKYDKTVRPIFEEFVNQAKKFSKKMFS